MAKYICNGAQCKCTMGTDKGTLDVKSQTKIFIQDKLMATENENTFLPNFVNCNKTNPPTPCQPIIETPWTSTKSNVFQSEHKGLLEASTAFCTFGKGTISILDSKQSDTKNVIFGDYSSEPKEISKVYAKVRTLDDYKGEFGFDWVDVNPETMEIQKIQGVSFDDVEYFYKKGNTAQDLGNIIPIGEDKSGAIQAIQKNYGLTNFDNHFEIPFVLVKPGQPAKLSLEVFFEGESQDDYISITGDEFYSFKIDGEEERKDKNDKTTKKKIVANEKLKLTINCSKESLDKKYFFLHTGAQGPREIGGLNMMENKVLKLKFRVIALVSNEGNPNEKAKALFKKFKNAKIAEYLNKDSLNQAGYEVEIENKIMFENPNNPNNPDINPDINLDDYFYAFDKEAWRKEKYFAVDVKRTKNVLGKDENGNDIWIKEIQEGQLGDWIVEDGVDKNGDVIYVVKKQNQIDNITINAYKNKLSADSKKYDSGGIIILSDLECTNITTAAYSKISPVDHYALIVFADAIESKSTYAHELGHMLGLEHTFCDEDVLGKRKKIDEYKIDTIEKLNLQINEEKIKNQISQTNKSPKPLKDQSKITTEFKEREYVTKSTLIEAINNSNIYYALMIKKYNDFINDKTYYSYYNWGSQKLNKQQFIGKCTVEKEKNETYKNVNNAAKVNLEKYPNNKLINFKSPFYLLYEDVLKIYNDHLNFKLIKEWQNATQNFLYFTKKSTLNIMDYSQKALQGQDTVEGLKFLSHQITIMRKDYENYN